MSRDRLLAVGLLLASVALAYFLGVHWWFVAGHRAIAREMADLAEQAARFQAIIAQRPEIEARLERVRAFEATNPAFCKIPTSIRRAPRSSRACVRASRCMPGAARRAVRC